MTAIAFFAAALLCLWTGLRPRTNSSLRIFPLLWATLAALLLLHGMQASHGVLSHVTERFRQESRQEGWYGERRELQADLLWVLPSAGFVFLVGGSLLIRRGWLTHFPALGTVAYLCAVAAIRMISFHDVDGVLAQRYLEMSVSKWVNIVGILLSIGSLLWLETMLRRVSRAAPT